MTRWIIPVLLLALCATAGAEVLRTEAPEYKGLLIWDSRDPGCPVYFALHLAGKNYAGATLTADGMKAVDSVIAGRVAAAQAAADAKAAEEAAKAAEAKRVTDLENRVAELEAELADIKAVEVVK